MNYKFLHVNDFNDTDTSKTRDEKMRKKGMGGKRLAVGIGRQAHDEEVVHSSSSFAHLEKKVTLLFLRLLHVSNENSTQKER